MDMSKSGRWWRTGKLGVLQSTGSQRVRHDWLTEQQQQSYGSCVAKSGNHSSRWEASSSTECKGGEALHLENRVSRTVPGSPGMWQSPHPTWAIDLGTLGTWERYKCQSCLSIWHFCYLPTILILNDCTSFHCFSSSLSSLFIGLSSPTLNGLEVISTISHISE